MASPDLNLSFFFFFSLTTFKKKRERSSNYYRRSRMATTTEQNRPAEPFHQEYSGNHTDELHTPMEYSSPGSSITQIPDDSSGVYPEGGTRGWLCVFGSFMGLTGSLGLIN